MYSHILVALDGSEPSRFAGQTAVAIAVATRARVTACHVYGAQMHRRRFVDMEPGLPAQYQEQERLSGLRTAHDNLIDEGFRALSTGYIEDFVASARASGIAVETVTAEGRSYVGILHLAREYKVDLIALGAEGLGAVGDGMLGGATSRVLANAPCDVLVVRRGIGDGPILAGVDGSEEALKAAAPSRCAGPGDEEAHPGSGRLRSPVPHAGVHHHGQIALARAPGTGRPGEPGTASRRHHQ